MITSQLLAGIFPNTTKAQRDRFIAALNKFLPLYNINTYLRVCAFLATGGVETDYLRVTTEYASGKDYEGRKDLGNTQKGDGVRFKGRGFFQTTGRYNYGRVNARLRSKLKIDFLKNPERLAEIDVAVESACLFWVENNLEKYADAGEFKKLSAVVNCGNPRAVPNHWGKRNELYSLCKRRVPKDISFAPAQGPIVTTVAGNSTYTTQTNEPATLQPTNVAPEPIVLTPTEPPANDSFLADAFDRNVSADEVKTAARTTAPRILARFTRPFLLLYAALEAGNIYAWLGVACGVIAVGLLIYWHRNDFKRIFQSIKTKATTA